jgi:uncharacterized membrane protein
MTAVDSIRRMGFDRPVDQAHTAPAQASRLTIVAGIILLVGLAVFGWAAPGAYDVYLMVHVLSAVVWVGGGATLVVLVLLTERENDPRALAALGEKIHIIASRIFIPTALVVLLFGILMMFKGDLDWGEFWVIAGLVGFAATFLTGIGFLEPQTKRFNALAAEKGVEAPETQAALKKLLLVARFDIAMLLLVVADMTAKPFS